MIKKKTGVRVKGLKAPMYKVIELAHHFMIVAGHDLVITSAVRPAKESDY